MIDISSQSMEELKVFLKEKNQPSFRAEQIYYWLHVKLVRDFDQMTNLSRDLRQALSIYFYISQPKIKKKLVSSIDNTVKYLYEFQDGQCVEAVLMRYKHGNSLCISTQAGCRMGCSFCASTKAGKVRDLTAGEMLGQIYAAQVECEERISNIVLMGIGEPLDNYDNVLRFLRMISDPNGLNISLRHVSLSTCGVVDKINALAKEKLQLTLSVSLHAPDDELRNTMMPINKKWNIEALLAACRNYIKQTGRRISFEYALIDGVNDSGECAQLLAQRLKGMLCHVNLIPVNTVEETDYRESKKQQIANFIKILEQNGINVTIRRKLGADIAAACGQLRREQVSLS